VRFLNFDVVTTSAAHRLLPRIAECCKEGGTLILFGHTPVLVSAQWLDQLGLDMVQRNASWGDGQAAFQYYVARKRGPLKSVGLFPELGSDANVEGNAASSRSACA
jgi:isonocardicin synthase